MVNKGVFSTTGNIVTNVEKAAEQTVDIIVDRVNSEISFTPLMTAQQEIEQKNKMAEKQEKMFCGR
jgi:hypothetical protein